IATDSKDHSCVATINALEIFWGEVEPVETGLGETGDSGRRIGRSDDLLGASYPHDSARKSRGFKSDTWIRDLGLFQAIPSKGPYSIEHSCVTGIFLFLNLGRGLPTVCNSFGRDCRFILQNRLIGCFPYLPCGGLQACETSRVGPPLPDR